MDRQTERQKQKDETGRQTDTMDRWKNRQAEGQTGRLMQWTDRQTGEMTVRHKETSNRMTNNEGAIMSDNHQKTGRNCSVCDYLICRLTQTADAVTAQRKYRRQQRT